MVESAYSAEVSTADNATWQMTVQGEIDTAAEPNFRQTTFDTLNRPEASTLVMDLSRLSFMDSTGLKVIIDADQHAAQTKRELRIRGPLQPSIRRLFELAGVNEVLTLDSTVAA